MTNNYMRGSRRSKTYPLYSVRPDEETNAMIQKLRELGGSRLLSSKLKPALARIVREALKEAEQN